MVGAIIIFILSWWLCLFSVLSFGVRSQRESGHVIDGTEQAAPVNPMLLKKAMWATLGAMVITCLMVFLIVPWLSAQSA